MPGGGALYSDLVRLHEFLNPVNPLAALRVARQLVAGAKRIPIHPRLGVRMPGFDPREVRKVRYCFVWHPRG